MTEFTDQSIKDEPQNELPKPVVAGHAPVVVDVEAGESYWWCACGKSAAQPFCDGSHKGSSFTPLQWVAEKDGKVAFCTCKQSKKQPLCDGTHKRLDDLN